MQNIKVDLIKKEIIVPTYIYKRSLTYGSHEHMMLSEIIHAYPSFYVKVKERKSNTNKALFPTFEKMEQFITMNAPDTENALHEFHDTIEFARCSSNAYNLVRKWFFQRYGKEYKSAMGRGCYEVA